MVREGRATIGEIRPDNGMPGLGNLAATPRGPRGLTLSRPDRSGGPGVRAECGRAVVCGGGCFCRAPRIDAVCMKLFYAFL